MIRTLFATTALAAVMTVGAYAQTTVTVPGTEPTVGQQVDKALDAAGNAMQNAGDAVRDAAQDAGTAVDNAAANANAAANNAANNVANATRQPFELATGYVVNNGDAIVTAILGSPVYSDTTENAEEIGKVNDLVIGLDGNVQAVVIGVGGFLGIGEKNVAVDFASLDFTIAFDNTERWVLPTTAEALTTAPEFVWNVDGAVTPAPAM